MAFSTDLLTLLPSTLKVSTRSSHSNYGEPSFAATTSSYRCRVLQKPGYLRMADSEEVAYKAVAWVRSTGATSITASDRVTLPDGTRPPVLSVERYSDEDGPNHCMVYFAY